MVKSDTFQFGRIVRVVTPTSCDHSCDPIWHDKTVFWVKSFSGPRLICFFNTHNDWFEVTVWIHQCDVFLILWVDSFHFVKDVKTDSVPRPCVLILKIKTTDLTHQCKCPLFDIFLDYIPSCSPIFRRFYVDFMSYFNSYRQWHKVFQTKFKNLSFYSHF